jgi:hypothetical protein
MSDLKLTSRRHFLQASAGAVAATGMAPHSVPAPATADDQRAASKRPHGRHRVGAVAYGYQYSIGLFSYRDRSGERFDAVQFLEANHAAGGEVAQLYVTMIRDLDVQGLKRLRRRAEELDVLLEVHGGGALGKWANFEDTMRRTAQLGC